MSVCLRMVCLVAAIVSAEAAMAGDAYYDIPIRDVKIVEGKLPSGQGKTDWRRYGLYTAMRSHVVVDGQGEAYVTGQNEQFLPSEAVVNMRLCARAPEGKDVTGRLIVPNVDKTGMTVLKFTIPSSAAKPEAKTAFYQGKIAHYEQLRRQDIPGGAWFRHQIRLARLEQGQKSDDAQTPTNRWRPSGNELTRTYDLFTGSRAMSENLQLDRELPNARTGETPVKIDTLQGITINEIDWKPLLKDAAPKLDPLSEKIPADQHVVFFPDFQKAMAVADEAGKHDTPVLRLAQPRSENAKVVERYQRQLGLSMSTVARLLGPAFVKSVALTGSDPYFPIGTDVAVLFESPQPAMLENLLYGRVALAAAQAKDVKPVTGEVDGLKYRGFLTPDRSVSSYIAHGGGVVIVTNSIYQLKQFVAVQKDKSKSIAGLPEYKFFRNRYRLGDPDESALVFVSDATIRRWCGPRWRIADSRRTRARAILAELQASQLDALVKNTVKTGPIHTDLPILGGGELTLGSSGVSSSVFGTLDFMTPIGETPLDEVTQMEADSYRAWRDGYQRNWSWGFDPIALRISLGKEKLAADLTVMPLIMNTQYRDFISISTGGKYGPTAGDPHDALAQFMLAINRDSHWIRQGETFASTMGQAVSLGWIGRWVSVYADDDPLWKELATIDEDKAEHFLEKNVSRLPIAVQVDVSNPLKLAVFLTSARAFIEQSAPGLVQWESLKYKEKPYVRITPVKGKGTVPSDFENLAIYYAASGDALTITLSEKILQRVIERRLAREKASAEKEKTLTEKPARTWLGQNVALRVDSRILDIVNAMTRQQYQRTMQTQCWSNLPILNEWKRLYPDRDPMKVHEEVWGVELVCPAGGKYVWNEKYQTMESTVYGHPGEPKEGPAAPPVLSSFAVGDFGLTFENKGLRAQTVLERRPTKSTESKK